VCHFDLFYWILFEEHNRRGSPAVCILFYLFPKGVTQVQSYKNVPRKTKNVVVKVLMIQCSSICTMAGFTRCWCSKRSHWNLTFHRPRERFFCLKIRSFLSIHIFHVAHIATSVKQGPENRQRASGKWEDMGSELSQWKLAKSQQETANGHWKKRCSLVCKTWFEHRTHFFDCE
jgi:hypothetical protein